MMHRNVLPSSEALVCGWCPVMCCYLVKCEFVDAAPNVLPSSEA